jgi:lipid-binding SYLF domain-containing protein
MRTAITLALLAALVGCGSTKPESESDAQALNSECDTAMAKLKTEDPSLVKWFDTAHGYAVFPSIGKGAIGIGGAYGKGQVYESKKLVGYTTMKQGTIGLALGGQAFTEVIFFKDKAALDEFTRGNFEFDAGASAVALTAGASRDIAYSKGVAVVTATKGGLMYEAAIGGQKFSFERVGK